MHEGRGFRVAAGTKQPGMVGAQFVHEVPCVTDVLETFFDTGEWRRYIEIPGSQPFGLQIRYGRLGTEQLLTVPVKRGGRFSTGE